MKATVTGLLAAMLLAQASTAAAPTVPQRLLKLEARVAQLEDRVGQLNDGQYARTAALADRVARLEAAQGGDDRRWQLQSQINKANSDALAAVGDALKSIVGPKAGG